MTASCGSFPPNSLWGNYFPVCPYCSAEQHVEAEYERTEDVVCSRCEKKFRMECRTEVRFDTVGDCELNGELPHTLKLTTKHVMEYTCTKCRANWYDWQLPGGTHPRLEPGQFEIVGPELTEYI